MNYQTTAVAGDDSALLDSIFEFGKANVLPVETACSAIPYPTRSDLQAWADTGRLVALSDNEGLRFVFHYDEAGTIRGVIVKPFIDAAAGQLPGDDPRGPEMLRYVGQLLVLACGAARSVDPNAATQKVHAEVGIEVL